MCRLGALVDWLALIPSIPVGSGCSLSRRILNIIEFVCSFSIPGRLNSFVHLFSPETPVEYLLCVGPKVNLVLRLQRWSQGTMY